MSSLTIGQMYQLAKKLEAMSWGAGRVTQLGQATPKNFRDIEAILDGRAKVEIIRYLAASTTFTLPAVKRPKRLNAPKGVWFSDAAARLFGSVSKLQAVSARTFEYRDIEVQANDLTILEELGGTEAALFEIVLLEVALGQLFDGQRNGEPGTLQHTGMANIAYVPDPENPGRVLYVNANRNGDEWNVNCNPANANEWNVGNRVLKQPTVSSSRTWGVF